MGVSKSIHSFLEATFDNKAQAEKDTENTEKRRR
jgi:hypothetical protein